MKPEKKRNKYCSRNFKLLCLLGGMFLFVMLVTNQLTLNVKNILEDPSSSSLYFAADLIPFLNCTINDGTTCTAVWGYSNGHNVAISTPLFDNKFTPAPVYRGQPTVFPANSLVYRAFNTSRPCSSGLLAWTLKDPITGITRTIVANTTLGSTCNLPTRVNVTCQTGNPTIVAQRLQLCQSQCGSQCPYCGQVYSFCENSGSINSNFTLENCMIVNLGFNLVSNGCNYLSTLNGCCSNVGPPITPPVTPPVTPPITPPVAPPLSPPVAPPTPPQPNCGTTNLETYAAADSCLSTSGNCSLLALNCSNQISAVVNQDQAGLDCITSFINLQTVNCQDGLALGYVTCCNQTVPSPTQTEVCPLTTSNVLTSYECISRETSGITCADRTNTCNLFLTPLTNTTESQTCLATQLSASLNLTDCDYFNSLEFCCNQTIPTPVAPPVQPPVVVPVSPPVTPPIAPPITPPITPPVTPPITPPVAPPITPPVSPPVNPPFPPPSATCDGITQQRYNDLVNCMTTTPGTCPTKVAGCLLFINVLSSGTLGPLCIQVGLNSSTNAVDCNVTAVVSNCCDPVAGQQCPINLGAVEQYAVFSSGTGATGTLSYSGIGNLTVSSNAGWSASTALKSGNVIIIGNQDTSITAGPTAINSALTTIGSLTATGALPPFVNQTFTPGVYKNTGLITFQNNAVVTFDAQSNPYAVFIFYTSGSGSGYSIANNVVFNLINGAHSSNIFIAGPGQLNMGSTNTLSGNFLTQTSTVTIQSNVNINGRLLCSFGSSQWTGGTSTLTRLPAVKNPNCP